MYIYIHAGDLTPGHYHMGFYGRSGPQPSGVAVCIYIYIYIYIYMCGKGKSCDVPLRDVRHRIHTCCFHRQVLLFKSVVMKHYLKPESSSY